MISGTKWAAVVVLISGGLGLLPRSAKAYAPVSYADYSVSDKPLMYHGQPFLYTAAQISPHRLSAYGWSWPDMQKIFQSVANDGFTTIGVPIKWSWVEPATNNFDWTTIDYALGYANQFGLKLEIMWFGSDVCTKQEGAPSWVDANYQGVLNGSGQLVFSNDGKKKLDKTDPNLLAKEKTTVAALMNHIRARIISQNYADVVVGFQVLNEPTVINTETGVAGTDRSHSAYANSKWSAGGYSDATIFNSDVMYEYLNGLAQAVKTSDYSVWTRTNTAQEWGLFVNVIFKKAAAANNYLDFIGQDPYVVTNSQAYAVITSQWINADKNISMIMENSGAEPTTNGMMFNAFAGYGYYHVFEYTDSYSPVSSGGWNQGMYTINSVAKSIAAKPHVQSVRDLVSMLKKDGADVAAGKNPTKAAYFNRDFVAPYSADLTVNGDPINYASTNGGAGIALFRDAATYVFMSLNAGQFRVPAGLTISSLQTGYYDANNAWVAQGDVSYANNTFNIGAYNCVRLVYTRGGATVDATAPTVPAGLGAQAASSSQINLTWTASADNVGVAGYKIFRGGAQIATAAGTSYSDTGLNASTAYSYTVAAYDGAGNTSGQSAAASATTQASVALLPPTILSPVNGAAIVDGTNKVTVSWAAAAGATGYAVRMADNEDGAIRDSRNTSGCAYVCIDDYAGTQITVDARSGHTYHFWIHSRAGSGAYPGPSWSASNAVDFSYTYATTPPPDAVAPTGPAGLSAQAASSSQINLTWTASSDNVGVTGYKIFRGGAQIATTAGTAYSDTGLTASTAYSYTVAAYDAAGNASGQSTAASATTQAPPATLTCPGPGNGTFSACYFNNMTLDAAGLALTRSEATVNFDWGAGAPDASVNADNFSAAWQGNFAFNASDYTFSMSVDDGGRLYVDGTLVIDKWINQPASTYTFTQTMAAGTHLIKLEYYENAGDATAKLSWSQTGAPPIATDLNGDGVSNVTDVQLAVNQALGTAACVSGDVNKDGACNVTDVQKVVNAAMGL